MDVAIPIYKVGIFYLIKLYMTKEKVAIPIYKVGIFYMVDL